MLEQVMRDIRNYFPVESHHGTFTIENGVISPLSLHAGQYYMIEGSTLNDGVYKYGEPIEQPAETFTGYITVLAPPKAFLEIVSEIEAYQAKYGDVTPYTSESFGGYSYTKASGSNGGSISWADAFGKRLNAWRKI